MPTGKVYPGYPAIHPKFVAQVAQANGASAGAIEVAVSSAVGVATATLTVAGTPTTGKADTITLNGHAVTFNQTTGNSLTQEATGIKNAINGDGTDAALVLASSNVAVVTLTALAVGSAGMVSLSASSNGGETVTAGGTQLDIATYIIPKTTFQMLIGPGQPFTFYQDYAYIVDAATKTAMRSAGYIY